MRVDFGARPRHTVTARRRKGRLPPSRGKDLIYLPGELSYADDAQVACGLGTVYEGLQKIGISKNDSVLITGLGPVGLATGALCRKLGASGSSATNAVWLITLVGGFIPTGIFTGYLLTRNHTWGNFRVPELLCCGRVISTSRRVGMVDLEGFEPSTS